MEVKLYIWSFYSFSKKLPQISTGFVFQLRGGGEALFTKIKVNPRSPINAMGERLDFVSCCIVSFHSSIVSSIYWSFLLLTHFLSFPLMSVCWITHMLFSISLVLSEWDGAIGLWIEITSHVQGEAVKNQSALSLSLLPGNLGSHSWREQNHEVASIWLPETLGGGECLPNGTRLGVSEKQTFTVLSPEIWGFIC